MDNAAGLGSEAPSGSSRTRSWPILPIAAALWWLVGALPWILSGLGDEVRGGYLSLLPFQASLLPQLLTITLCGGAAAGLATLWLRDRSRRRVASCLAAVGGSFVATAYTVAQATGATRSLGADFDSDRRVLAGVVAVAAVGSVVGTLLGLLVALGGPVTRAVAAAPLAVAAGGWATGVLVAAVGIDTALPFLPWGRYVVGALMGLALATLGLRPARRLVAWVVALLLLAVTQAVMTAFTYVTPQLRPGAGLPAGLSDLVDAGRDVFLLALQPEHQPWVVYVIALAGGLAGALVLWRRPDGTGGAAPALAGG
ncbi:hypothetical protein GCM10027053_09870 [Intrasporangium mesophilum]